MFSPKSNHYQLQRQIVMSMSAALIILQTAGDSNEELLASSQQWAKDSLPQFLTALQQHAWELDKLYLPHPDWTAEW